MRFVVTGGSGFIGSTLTDALLARGDEVVVVDNFTTGRREFLADAETQEGCTVVEADLLGDADRLPQIIDGSDTVVHLAANADVRFGWNDTRRDLEQNIVATLNVLDAMRAVGTKRILFSSTASVYGENPVIPSPEDAPFPVQTSLYGASKAAAEGFVAAWAEAGLVSATVFRFVSIVGPRYTHGHIIDFVAHLVKDPTRLLVLGDGTQRKCYLDVSDCVSALLNRLDEQPRFEVLNLGVDGACTVNESIAWISTRLDIAPTLEYAGGRRGWIGDNPLISLDTSRIRSHGWKPTYSIREAVERTVDYLMSNQWLLEDHNPARS